MDLRQPGVALREGSRRDLLVHDAAADADLLLGGEERCHELAVAADQPAAADAGDAVGLGQRADADGAVAQRGGHGQRVAEGHLPVGLVDEQPAAGSLDPADDAAQVGLAHGDAGGVVRQGDADVLRAWRDQRHELVGVDAKAVLEGEVEVAHVRLDGPRRLDVGGVVRADDDEVVALVEQRGGDDEERLGGARRDEHVVTAHAAARPSALRGDQFAKRVVAEVVAVEEDHVADLDAEVGQ